MNAEVAAPGMTRVVLEVPTGLIERIEALWSAPGVGAEVLDRTDHVGFWSSVLAHENAQRDAWRALARAARWPLWLSAAFIGADEHRGREIGDATGRLRSVWVGRSPVDPLAELELGDRAAQALADSVSAHRAAGGVR